MYIGPNTFCGCANPTEPSARSFGKTAAAYIPPSQRSAACFRCGRNFWRTAGVEGGGRILPRYRPRPRSSVKQILHAAREMRKAIRACTDWCNLESTQIPWEVGSGMVKWICLSWMVFAMVGRRPAGDYHEMALSMPPVRRRWDCRTQASPRGRCSRSMHSHGSGFEPAPLCLFRSRRPWVV